MKNKDTFTLWGVQHKEKGTVIVARTGRSLARHDVAWYGSEFRAVKLECRIVEQRPKKPKTFTAHGRTWISHTPGDPMPCDGEKRVRVLLRSKEHDSSPASSYHWEKIPVIPEAEIIGWNYAD